MKYSELEIAGMLQDNNDTINELKEKVKKLQLQIDTVEMNKQRDIDMQNTIDAFADINAECEAERKE